MARHARRKAFVIMVSSPRAVGRYAICSKRFLQNQESAHSSVCGIPQRLTALLATAAKWFRCRGAGSSDRAIVDLQRIDYDWTKLRCESKTGPATFRVNVSRGSCIGTRYRVSVSGRLAVLSWLPANILAATMEKDEALTDC